MALRRRSFLGTIAAAGGGLALGWRIPAGSALAQAGGHAVGHLGGDQPRRHHRRAHRPLGNGAGHADRPRATRRRRARLRLAACARRICVARRQPGEQARLGRHVHRRQPRHPRLGGLRAQGWRGGSRHADRGGGAAVERSGDGMHRGEQRGHAHAERPDAALRRGRGRCGEAAGADRREAEDAGAVDDHRQGREAARYGRQAVGQAGVRHRRAVARHAECGDRAMSGVRRHAEILRRRQDQIDAGRAPGGRGGRQRGRGGGRQVVPGEDRARRAADRLGRRRRRHRGQRADRRTAEGPAWMRRRRRSARSTATSRRRSPVRRRWSRRCTPRRSSPTPRWSR